MKIVKVRNGNCIIYAVKAWREKVFLGAMFNSNRETTLTFDFECRCEKQLKVPRYRGQNHIGICPHCGATIAIEYDKVWDNFIVPIVRIK